MSRPVTALRRTAAVLLPSLALTLLPASSASADDRPETIEYPDRVQPEGITTGPGTMFFAGAISGGTIYRGDVRTGALTTLVQRGDTAAIGLFYDAATKRIWVAGGPTGQITAYDARTGAIVFAAPAVGAGFLNDVAVTRDAVTFTDSARAQLFVVPLGKGGALPSPDAVRTVPVTGHFVQSGAFGLNGLRPLPDGGLLAVDTATGDLVRIDPVTGVSTLVPGSEYLVSGDGIELKGTVLYVTGGEGENTVAVLGFDNTFSRVTRTTTLTDPDLSTPSTVAVVAGDLYAVNARFGQAPTVTRQVVRVDGS